MSETTILRPNTSNATRTTKLTVMNPSRQNQRQGSRKTQKQSPDFMPMYRHVGRFNKIERWMTLKGTIATSAGGIIPIATASSSDVNASTDWASMSQEYAQYRVKQIIVRLVPINFENAPNPALCIYLDRWWGLKPTTVIQMVSEPSFFGKSSNEEIEIENNWQGFPDAKSFTNVGSSIPTEQSFGVAFISETSPTARVSTTYFVYYYRFLTEFVGPQ